MDDEQASRLARCPLPRRPDEAPDRVADACRSSQAGVRSRSAETPRLFKGAAALRSASHAGRCSDSSDPAAGRFARRCARTAPLPRSRRLPVRSRSASGAGARRTGTRALASERKRGRMRRRVLAGSMDAGRTSSLLMANRTTSVRRRLRPAPGAGHASRAGTGRAARSWPPDAKVRQSGRRRSADRARVDVGAWAVDCARQTAAVVRPVSGGLGLRRGAPLST
jgi:hypothetical protein